MSYEFGDPKQIKLEDGVTDVTRTRNNQNHNLGLYH